MREQLKEAVLKQFDDSYKLVEYMYENPEIGNQEFKAMDVLCKELRAKGFEVEEGYVVPTGFIGKYDSGKEGPVIGFMCEYDALPEVGHGCGHNLIAGMSLTAAVALKSMIDDLGGKIWVLGTPAEENFGGKISFADAGVFDDVDVALMLHPSSENSLGGRTNALMPLKFEFFGTPAHGCIPYEGKSALDAAVMTFLNINLLRQYVEPHTYIHGIVRDGGQAANVIPPYASLEYYFRGATMAYVNKLCARAQDIVDAACKAAGVTSKTSVYECPYDDIVINYLLADMLKDKYEQLGYTEIKPVNELPQGSTDVGAVSYRCPTLQGMIKIAGKEVNGHSKELAAATIDENGKKALVEGAWALADIAADLLEKPELLAAAKKELADTLAAQNK
ncbi:MAG: M20 family metallopeptidase [Oscillospiraceae bacterium]|nr:M20 family metallopeptidase [Oscillospiraceae bacterium]